MIAAQSNLQIYLKQINEAPLLNAEEEKLLGGIIQEAQDWTDKLQSVVGPIRARASRRLETKEARKLRTKTMRLLREVVRTQAGDGITTEEAQDSVLPYVKLVEEKYSSSEDGEFADFACKIFELAVRHSGSAKKAQIAREQMVRSNLRLVVNIAKTYSNRGMSLADLIEEGNLGLLRAVEGYDPGHDTRFSTYASWWIKQAIKRSLINAVQPIHIPAYMVEMISRWKQAQKEIQEKEGRQPTTQELADHMDVPKRKLRIIKQAVRAISSSTQANDEDGPGLSEMLMDEKTPSPDEALFTQAESDSIRSLLDQIDSREAMILRLRYGLEGGAEPLTLKEIGAKIGLTRERVRQIEREALGKLQELIGQE